MCIMEVRPGQRNATIAQACAHNLSTVDRDLEMFVSVLRARGDHDVALHVQQLGDKVHTAYAEALTLFEDRVAADAPHWHGDDTHGNERPLEDLSPDMRRHLEDVAHHDAQLARRFETR